MEVDVFSIFPDGFLHLHHAGNFGAACADFAQHIVDGVTRTSFPR